MDSKTIVQYSNGVFENAPLQLGSNWNGFKLTFYLISSLPLSKLKVVFFNAIFSQNEGQSKKFEPIGRWLDRTVVDILSSITHGSNIYFMIIFV